MKLKWRVGEKPTGRYRSFQQRSWPTADYDDGTYAGCICPVGSLSYHIRIAETTELRVYVALHNTHAPGWRAVRLKQTFVGVSAAKQALSDYLDAHPEAWPLKNSKDIDAIHCWKRGCNGLVSHGKRFCNSH